MTRSALGKLVKEISNHGPRRVHLSEYRGDLDILFLFEQIEFFIE